jgi:hypothetical protein
MLVSAMLLASERLDTAPVFPGQLPRGVAGPWAVYEPCGDSSELVRNFAQIDRALVQL